MKRFVELVQRVYQENFQTVIDKIVAEKIPVAFFSTAPYEKAVGIAENLRSQNLNITDLILLIPPPPHTANSNFKITTLENVSKIHPRPEYIITVGAPDPRVAAKHISDCKVLSLEGPWWYPREAYPSFMNHLTDLREVYESLIDEESKKTFYGYWLSSITHRIKDLVFTETPHYLTPGFIPKKGDIFIDVGVCDGGTAIRFSKLGCVVYGFEIDKKNFEISKKVAEENNFIVENLGLGSYNHEANYFSSGGGSQITENGSDTATIVTLDSYVENNGLAHVDFIKMDVEGAELDVLKGAVTTIARFKPIIAASVYHKWSDFWILTKFLKSIRPDYEFALRHYPETKEDLPTAFENHKEEYFLSLGLEPDVRGWEECVLLAR